MQKQHAKRILQWAMEIAGMLKLQKKTINWYPCNSELGKIPVVELVERIPADQIPHNTSLKALYEKQRLTKNVLSRQYK